ncbi:nuclear transport factor 2 family protein [Stigmatella sp. ncwal1]|uniref:Nuclear transport factor 2 family protein n=1 Tax=Stigmatella ashevillensis TaxID=2995309 RepID=A0ABT5DK10_9BACT|nr:nuclear transport factor 2 family protein [Stigmatella ashevillena]MDC0713963.1 nuclear transport factor 2 family protein [Stigmatella ashevillena]
MSMTNLEVVQSYLQALEQGATGEALARFFHPEVSQREFPNRLTPSGATRDMQALLDAAKRGQKVMTSQRYKVLQAVAQGDQVALEVDWSGTLAVPLGSLPAGGTMRAWIGMFVTVRDGRILSQRNYDCFEPF